MPKGLFNVEEVAEPTVFVETHEPTVPANDEIMPVSLLIFRTTQLLSSTKYSDTSFPHIHIGVFTDAARAELPSPVVDAVPVPAYVSI